MGRCRFEVTFSRLAAVLGLPEGTRIYRVREVDSDVVFEVFAEHPELPALRGGIVPPLAMPIVAVEPDGNGHLVKWGLPE